MASSSASSSLSWTPPSIIDSRFRLQQKIGCGSYGEIFEAEDLLHGQQKVAVKLEKSNVREPHLSYESRTYKRLQGGEGIPTFIWYGEEVEYKALVLEILGPSLQAYYDLCSKRFSLKTVLMLAEQMLQRLEFIHKKSYVHRDLKPSNFLMGVGSNKHKVYMIDFGLSTKFANDLTGEHVPCRETRFFVGNARFCSTNVHFGRTQSRRDDLESLGYVFLYLLGAKIPWKSVMASTKQELFDKARVLKLSTSLESLCEGYPEEFRTYLTYCRGLGFTDVPNYAYLRGLFETLFQALNLEHDGIYDWTPLTDTIAAEKAKNTVTKPNE